MIFILINIYCKRKFGSKAFGNLSNYFKYFRFADAEYFCVQTDADFVLLIQYLC